MAASAGTKNIFLTSRESGDVKVGDFGLSRALSQSTSELALTVCGTPFYLSPELVSGSPYGVPADLWSLGVVLFELLTLQRPFVAPNFAALIQEVMACSYDESLLTRCGHDAALRNLASRDGLLHPDAKQRATLAHVVARLDEAVAVGTPPCARRRPRGDPPSAHRQAGPCAIPRPGLSPPGGRSPSAPGQRSASLESVPPEPHPQRLLLGDAAVDPLAQGGERRGRANSPCIVAISIFSRSPS